MIKTSAIKANVEKTSVREKSTRAAFKVLLKKLSLLLVFTMVGVHAVAEATIDSGHKNNTQAQTLVTALSQTDRSDADRQRDLRSKPLDTLALLELKPGQQVADIFAGGGYYSHIIAHLLGPEGKVYVHNNAAYRKYVGTKLEERFADTPLLQVRIHDHEISNLALPAGQLDAILMVMSYHDLYFIDDETGWNNIDSKDFIAQLYRAMKPGGKLLVIDHSAVAGSESESAQKLHRIDESFARKDFERAGFTFSDSSDVLRNPMDTRTVGVFDEVIRGKTDRFVLLFSK